MKRLLKESGDIQVLTSDTTEAIVHLPGETDVKTLDQTAIAAASIIRIEFAGPADGRGFSLGSDVRRRLGFSGELQASGRLNPDQLSMGFQCGFDAVIVDDEAWQRYGEASWVQALSKPSVSVSYSRSRWSSLQSIWDSRHP